MCLYDGFGNIFHFSAYISFAFAFAVELVKEINKWFGGIGAQSNK